MMAVEGSSTLIPRIAICVLTLGLYTIFVCAIAIGSDSDPVIVHLHDQFIAHSVDHDMNCAAFIFGADAMNNGIFYQWLQNQGWHWVFHQSRARFVQITVSRSSSRAFSNAR